MGLVLYNTLTHHKEPFRPMRPDSVGMYACGPTVYDFVHVGNARAAVVFDLLYRVLRRSYARVTYVRNITDVDDKIIDAAKRNGEAIESLTGRTEKAYQDHMAALGVLPPTVQPRATQHIAEMIAMIEALIAKGHAYVAHGTVLFHVPSDPTYGELSRQDREGMIAGARVDVAPYKRDPADFVLWKSLTADQPGWDSPWGRGRPGWHIECSAMADKYLGTTFDIHGGGQDLIFPHHENEIAQSRCAHEGAPLARYWVHNGFITMRGEKMAKSVGNVVTAHSLLQRHDGETIRLTLLSGHYRQGLDWTDEVVEQSKKALDRWYRAAGDAKAGEPDDEFLAALEDDLNTPLAIARLHGLADRALAGDTAAQPALKASAGVMGVLAKDAKAWFRGGATGTDEAEIEALIAQRAAAKKAKNYGEADRIRAALEAKNIVLEDTPKGTSWRRA
ncbi:MAG: cysteine--tRNA ligase [Alphaproteobacteria bacterium]|nr:cysteine--tRNA ligase [Alphaproteobacteria bacterium]